MKKLIDKIKKLSFAVKVQLLIAIICTLAVPVFAWFAHQDRIEAMSKVKEPPSINLASGGEDPAIYISLENIDVDTANHEKYVIFSVEPGKYSAYDIQLTHTTNIPFKYELYRIKEDEAGTIKYIDHSQLDTDTMQPVETQINYSIMNTYSYGECVTNGKVNLQDVNPDNNSTGRILGDENGLQQNRKNYTNDDDVNQYVKPLYSVARRIPQLSEDDDSSSGRDYFAIRLSWEVNPNIDVNNSQYWNYAFNNKETDIIYISAKQNTLQDAQP